MASFSPEEALRIARLARLGLTPEEAARLAPTLEAITRDFAALADAAALLPEAEPAAPVPLREDVVAAADDATADGILAAAPRVAGGRIQAPRGRP